MCVKGLKLIISEQRKKDKGHVIYILRFRYVLVLLSKSKVYGVYSNVMDCSVLGASTFSGLLNRMKK